MNPVLRFDHPQTVFDLPTWTWPDLQTYNGFTSAERIRGWQLFKFYEVNGWVESTGSCSVTGALNDVVWHDEDYFRPWTCFAVSRRTHQLIHSRFKRPDIWHTFLSEEALSSGWFRDLSIIQKDVARERRKAGDGCIEKILAAAPHPAWVRIPVEQFWR